MCACVPNIFSRVLQLPNSLVPRLMWMYKLPKWSRGSLCSSGPRICLPESLPPLCSAALAKPWFSFSWCKRHIWSTAHISLARGISGHFSPNYQHPSWSSESFLMTFKAFVICFSSIISTHTFQKYQPYFHSLKVLLTFLLDSILSSMLETAKEFRILHSWAQPSPPCVSLWLLMSLYLYDTLSTGHGADTHSVNLHMCWGFVHFVCFLY